MVIKGNNTRLFRKPGIDSVLLVIKILVKLIDYLSRLDLKSYRIDIKLIKLIYLDISNNKIKCQ